MKHLLSTALLSRNVGAQNESLTKSYHRALWTITDYAPTLAQWAL
ncbi:MAG TPA: hypothetical protein VNY06_08010 [Methylocella sp.]|nr:hypothetical protein [Methylocella sp.]